jgi:hypothetical protein
MHCRRRLQVILAPQPTWERNSAYDAPKQDAYRLLQRPKSKGAISDDDVRLPRLLLPTAAREESQAEHSVRELHAGGQRIGSEIHAANHVTVELPQSNGTQPEGHRALHNPVLRGWTAYYSSTMVSMNELRSTASSASAESEEKRRWDVGAQKYCSIHSIIVVETTA